MKALMVLVGVLILALSFSFVENYNSAPFRGCARVHNAYLGPGISEYSCSGQDVYSQN
jgi:hypothetical protein